MNVNFEISQDVAAQLRSAGTDLNRLAKELLLVESFRRGLVTHAQLAQALGLDRFETDAFLKRHQVTEHSLGHQDVDADVQSINDLIGGPSRQ
jgi:predicted HTH domain antitoxin